MPHEGYSPASRFCAQAPRDTCLHQTHESISFHFLPTPCLSLPPPCHGQAMSEPHDCIHTVQSPHWCHMKNPPLSLISAAEAKGNGYQNSGLAVVEWPVSQPQLTNLKRKMGTHGIIYHVSIAKRVSTQMRLLILDPSWWTPGSQAHKAMRMQKIVMFQDLTGESRLTCECEPGPTFLLLSLLWPLPHLHSRCHGLQKTKATR